jgi:hypothetical protein
VQNAYLNLFVLGYFDTISSKKHESPLIDLSSLGGAGK